MKHSLHQFKIVLLGTLSAVAYGVLHDQITVRICPEYFTVAHPPLFHTTSLVWLAVCWGVAATMPIGLVAGAVLVLVTQPAGLPPYPLARLARRIFGLLAVMGILAVGAGCAGFYLSSRSEISMPQALDLAIPTSQQDRFMAVWFAHITSYLVGFTGMALLIVQVWKERGRTAALTLFPHSRLEILRAVLIAVVVAWIIWVRFGARS